MDRMPKVVAVFAAAALLAGAYWLAPALIYSNAPVSPPVKAAAERANETPRTPSEAAYARHIARRRKTLPDQYSIVRAGPFIVIGNDKPETVRAYAEGTVQWAVDHLKASYFEKDPARIIDIYLLKDKQSYRAFCKTELGRPPGTPFGFYSAKDNAMVMNIATGGGTLVHEIVHPFMEANFPACPAWFNEGLGSLYEQSAECDGQIVGLLNWRLPVLKRAIRRDKLVSFDKLLAMSDRTFYGQGSGRHYAQARYLCLYLQSQGKLRAFYQKFVNSHEDDPDGKAALKAVLGIADLGAFQQRWQRWVMSLSRDA